MDAGRVVDWEGSGTHVLLNPRLPAGDEQQLRRLVAESPALDAHVWLAASGSSGVVRVVALSKLAMLASAAAVNQQVASDRRDRWLCVLPVFHVGGLAIHARAHLTGVPVLSAEWNASAFATTCAEERITLTSLVPAQVRDLVREKLRAPRTLRAIFVGGGRLASALHGDARRLGWTLLPSYGMTECASQVATATLDDPGAAEPPLVLLPHLRARATDDGRLAFAGSSLLTGHAFERAGAVIFEDPKEDGWFLSEDVGRLVESGPRPLLEIEGRSSEFLKVGGESTSLARLDAILAEVLRAHPDAADAALVAMPDERLGWVIHMAVVRSQGVESIRRAFDERVLPFERVRQVYVVASIPRAALGKVLRHELSALVAKS
ncbi:MAG: AMP-binding protein [Gemmatimonadaceae bacterium]